MGLSLPGIDHDSESSQYMVEFGLTFAFFIFFVIQVFDISILIYNHHLLYHGASQAARESALGASNNKIKDTVVTSAVDNFLPSIMGRAHINKITISPKEEINRVRGTETSVTLDAELGFMVLGVYPLTLEIPISSHSFVTQKNDRDRDGCKDSMEGPNTPCDSYESFDWTVSGNHDNDLGGSTQSDSYYLRMGNDIDADDDGTTYLSDTVAIGYFGSGAPGDCEGYAIFRPNDGANSPQCSFQGNTWEEWFEGGYHAPEIWSDDSDASPKVFSRKLPKWHVVHSTLTHFTRNLRTEHDLDNDGWIDKYDDRYVRPEEH
ncbi:MAG: TadE/TadG family type IV pilus assembly protein [bacterium]